MGNYCFHLQPNRAKQVNFGARTTRAFLFPGAVTAGTTVLMEVMKLDAVSCPGIITLIIF